MHVEPGVDVSANNYTQEIIHICQMYQHARATLSLSAITATAVDKNTRVVERDEESASSTHSSSQPSTNEWLQ